MVRLLKNFLDKFDQIGVVNFIKDKSGNNLLMQQSLCGNIKRVFNDKYVEISDDINKNNIIILRNDPSNIESNKINLSEEQISIHYNDDVINLMGYKK